MSKFLAVKHSAKILVRSLDLNLVFHYLFKLPHGNYFYNYLVQLFLKSVNAVPKLPWLYTVTVYTLIA